MMTVNCLTDCDDDDADRMTTTMTHAETLMTMTPPGLMVMTTEQVSSRFDNMIMRMNMSMLMIMLMMMIISMMTQTAIIVMPEGNDDE